MFLISFYFKLFVLNCKITFDGTGAGGEEIKTRRERLSRCLMEVLIASRV